jgi:threonine dehydratase
MLDFHDVGEVVEPAGALGLSGVHVVSDRLRGDIATIVSGRCVSPDVWSEALRLAEQYSGRRIILDIIFPERDGALK